MKLPSLHLLIVVILGCCSLNAQDTTENTYRHTFINTTSIPLYLKIYYKKRQPRVIELPPAERKENMRKTVLPGTQWLYKVEVFGNEDPHNRRFLLSYEVPGAKIVRDSHIVIYHDKKIDNLNINIYGTNKQSEG